jgi:RimJ/RimL family protein N-acetyltransferase
MPGLIAVQQGVTMADDIWTQMARYRQIKVLPSGLRVLLRPLTSDDTEGLVDLFARADPGDLERLRSDPRDRQIVEGWVNNLDLHKVFPLVAIVNTRIIGEATIEFGEKFQRHLGWIWIFLDQEFRYQGVGTLMLKTLKDIGCQVGLHQLHALVPADQIQLIRAIEHLGFKNEFTYRDYSMLHNGHTLDVVVLVFYIVDHIGEF